MPTKRHLGVGYLVGVGMALMGSLLGYLWFSDESVLVLVVGTVTSLVLFASFVYVGHLLFDADLPEEFVWSVAQWGALGLGVTALLNLTILFGQRWFPDADPVPSLLVVILGSGGAIGILVGTVAGLREQRRRLSELNQRNTVMNRVLRHNVRNDMNVVLGQAQILAEGDADPGEVAANIEAKAKEVIRLSDAAREIDSISSEPGDGPIDIARMVERHAEAVRERYPAATLAVSVPAAAWADVDTLVQSVLDNLVENAIQHNDAPDPEVTVTVETRDEWVELRVADYGPGIPESQREVLFGAQEGPLRHGNGLGLWLVKWFVDHYGGDLAFEENEPRGTVVSVRLPATDSPPTTAAGGAAPA